MQRATLERPGDFIDGSFQNPAIADGELTIRSPADTNDVVSIHAYARGALHAGIASARKAWPAWRRLSIEARAEHLRRYQAELRAQHAALTDVIAREVGKPLWEAKTEVDAMIGKVDITLGEARRYTDDVRLADLPGEIRYRPLGVVAVIGPFNFPGHLPNGQIVPALLLGNCVVHKPSEKTPSAATLIARCAQAAGLPAGVLNVVQGTGAFGAELATDADVDGVMFTGSAAVGRRILHAQGERFDRLIALELGGKNAAVALDDCDIERTARAIAFSAYVTAGQRCTATSRLIATPAVADKLIARIAELAQHVRIGHPLSDGVFMGPVISESARTHLQAAQASARYHGFQAVLPGGSVEISDHPGFYVRPAIHVAPNADITVPNYTDAELFGPDLAVYRATDEEHAFALANRTTSGLTAAVYTGSREAFERAADVLRVGVLQWNRATAGASSRLPFGGIGQSGNHRPAAALAGLACTYALGIQTPSDAERARMPTWPGFEPS
jgi:succinylglutamic semialdehyde dehydrogenase